MKRLRLVALLCLLNTGLIIGVQWIGLMHLVLATCLIHVIRRLVRENRLWGAERLRGELLKFGIHVSKLTIQRYMRWVRGTHPRG